MFFHNNSQRILRPILFAGLYFLFSCSEIIHAQPGQPINLINADELQYSQSGGVKLRKLTGNVQMQQNDVTLFCDQANQFLDQNTIDAMGNVRIRQSDTINIYGNTLHYDGNSKMANLKGNVKLTDGHIILTTEQLDYDVSTRIANYMNGGKMINDSAVLTSRHGYYFANSSDIYFKKDVKLVHPEYVLTTDTLRFNTQSKIAYFVSPTYIQADSFDVYCEGGYFNTQSDIGQFEKNAVLKKPPQSLKADTIYFERLTGYGIARSHVRWADTLSKIFLKGNYAWYHENGDRLLATKNAVLITVIDNDSLFVAADTLYSFIDPMGNFRRLSAYHHVRLFKSDLQGVCDSVEFNFRDSTFRLFSKPVLWVDNNQLKADTINLILKNKKIDKMNLLQNAFAASEADSGLFNQARGKNMYGYFKDSELQRMEIIGNGESIYYAKDEGGGFIGVNKAVCSNMILYFDTTRKIDRIYFITQPDATLYPLSSFPQEESKLRNFVWLDALRPRSKQDLFH